MRKAILYLLFFISYSTSLMAQPNLGGEQRQEQLQTSKVWKDINYAGDNLAQHTCDIYLPKIEKESYPVVIHIYGSAWFSNNSKGQADLGTIVKALLDAGYAVVCPNHRNSTEAKWPSQLHDIKAVVRFIRGEAKTYKFDTNFIGTSGFSSGAHLAAITATTSGMKKAKIGGTKWDLEGTFGKYCKESSAVNACCEWSGPVDPFSLHLGPHMKMGDVSPEEILLDQKFGVKDERFSAMSAQYFIDPNDPPIMVFHGKKDNVVDFSQGERFYEALKAKGVKTDNFFVPEGGHGVNMYSMETLNRMVGFFNSVSGNKSIRANNPIGSNPIFRENYTADPAPMIASDGRMYVYCGHDECFEDSVGYEGKYGFNITNWVCYSTSDMKQWTSHGVVFSPQDFSWGEGEAWASQAVEKDGKYYYYVTAQAKAPYSSKCIGVAVGDSPVGPFRDAIGKPLITDDMTDNGPRGWWNDIDPTIFIDDDGTPWLCWGNGTCFLVKLKKNMTELDGDIITLKMEKYVEGPWLYKRNGKYYIVYASMGKGQETISYAMADTITGPYEYKGEICGPAKDSFTIHPGVIDFQGKSYLFYHNSTLSLNGYGPATGRRSVCVDEMHYNEDGTIQFVNLNQ